MQSRSRTLSYQPHFPKPTLMLQWRAAWYIPALPVFKPAPAQPLSFPSRAGKRLHHLAHGGGEGKPPVSEYT